MTAAGRVPQHCGQKSFFSSSAEPLGQRVEAGAVETVGADDAEGLACRTRLAVLVAPLFDETLGRIGAAGKHKAPLAVLVALGGVGDADVDPRREPRRSPYRYFHARHRDLQNQRSAGDLKPRAGHSRAGGFLKVVAKGHVPKRRGIAA